MMSESELSSATRSLLRAAKRDGPAVVTRAKIWQGVAATARFGGGIGGAAGVGAGFGSKLLLLGTLFGGTITVGLTLTLLRVTSPDSLPPVSPSPAFAAQLAESPQAAFTTLAVPLPDPIPRVPFRTAESDVSNVTHDRRAKAEQERLPLDAPSIALSKDSSEPSETHVRPTAVADGADAPAVVATQSPMALHRAQRSSASGGSGGVVVAAASNASGDARASSGVHEHIAGASNAAAYATHAAEEDAFMREVSLVAQARAALARGDAAAALRSVRAAQAVSPRQLVAEELALEARALKAIGLKEEASGVGEKLKTQFPNNALSR